MSVEQDTVSVQNDETSNVIQLRGRTGNIVEVLSNRRAVLRDKIYGDVTFTKNEVKFSQEQKGINFRRYFPIGRVVYFDIEVDNVRNVKCTAVWVSKKQESKSSHSQPISVTHETEEFVESAVYKGTVIQVRYPFAFVVEVDDPKMSVFVFNQAFKPTRHAEKLRRDEPVSLYVFKGDTVYVKVYRNKAGKEFEWSAWDAWMEGSSASEPSTSSKDLLCQETNKRQRKRKRKTKKGTCVMKGKLSTVGSVTAQLVSAECNDTVFFHRDNAFLFGVPMKELRLYEVLRKGEELSFVLSEVVEGEASHVWFGSLDTTNQNLRERTNCIVKYCMERGINDQSVLTTIMQELGRQRLPDEDKQEFVDEEEEIYDCYATRVCNGLSAGIIAHKELNDSTRSKSDIIQVDSHDTADRSTLSITTATCNTVTPSVLDINTVTAATKESGPTAVITQHDVTESKQNSCTLTAPSVTTVMASEPKISISTAATKQSDSTITITSTAAPGFAGENHIPMTAASITFVDSTEVAKIITNSLEPNSQDKADSLKDSKVFNELSAGSIAHKELNDSTRSKSDIIQVDSHGTADQSTLSTTATSNTVLDISTVTAATKESGSTAVSQQDMTASKQNSCTLTAPSVTTVMTSEQNISIPTAAAKQSDSTVTTASTAATGFADENHIPMMAASKTFVGSTENAKISTNSSETTSEVKSDYFRDKGSTTIELVNQTKKAHCEVENSTVAVISEHSDPLDDSQDHWHVDLRKADLWSHVSDTEKEMLCGTESGFHVSVINSDVEHNLELSLMSLLKKEVGESASQILAPYTIECFKKELNCMVPLFMGKALSSVIDNVTEQCDQDADSQCKHATGVTKISSMVQEWMKEMMLIADKQQEEKGKEMTALLDRAQRYRKRMSVLYSNERASVQRNGEEGSGNSCSNNNGDKNESFSNDGVNLIPDEYDDGISEESTLVGIVQGFMQLQNIIGCQMLGTPKCVSDQGTQTVSTGCVFYLKCLPDS